MQVRALELSQRRPDGCYSRVTVVETSRLPSGSIATIAGRRAAGGRYVLGDLLGRGGMAEVFAGRALGSLGFQKPVAIKRLLPSLACDEEFVGRLVDEA